MEIRICLKKRDNKNARLADPRLRCYDLAHPFWGNPRTVGGASKARPSFEVSSQYGSDAAPCPTMKNAVTFRATAGFLLLVMLVPAFGPLAMASMAPSAGMHCMRRAMTEAASGKSRQAASPQSAPAMRCHHRDAHSGAPQNSETQHSAASPEASFRSLDCCCGHCNYDCCCRTVRTFGWAKPATSHLSLVTILIEPAISSFLISRISAVLIGPDSARAPPRR